MKIRPFVFSFLKKMSLYYEIVVFTAATSSYAKIIVDYLDKDRKYISHIFSRGDCMETRNGFFIKDLRILGNRTLNNLVIVDNLAHSFGFQVENGIPIVEFLGEQDDCELSYLSEYLIAASESNDMREFNRENLKLSDMIDLPYSILDDNLYKAYHKKTQ